VEEREVPWSEIKKGYEITKNNYVVLEKGDRKYQTQNN
jgi:non-homologous end joining protein Ku